VTGRHLVTPVEDYISPEHRDELITQHRQRELLVSIYADGEGVYSLVWPAPFADGTTEGALVEGDYAYWEMAHALDHSVGDCWHYKRDRDGAPRHRAPEGEDVIDETTSRVAPEPKSAASHVTAKPLDSAASRPIEQYLEPELYSDLMMHLLDENVMRRADAKRGILLADRLKNATGASALRRRRGQAETPEEGETHWPTFAGQLLAHTQGRHEVFDPTCPACLVAAGAGVKPFPGSGAVGPTGGTE
jgi:hypothetical protein